jgi:hypothetical protein
MSTLTSKLQLFKPDGNDGVARVADLNNNWGILDAAVGVAECTSVTRPVSPYAGQIIRETDTLQLAVRNVSNTAWVYISAVQVVSATSDITAPYNGQMAFVTNNFSLFVYRSSTATWSRYPDSSTPQSTQNTSGTTSSTSFTTTLTSGTACGVAFVAPPSGKVMITNQMQGGNSVPASAQSVCTIRVCTGNVVGSGSVFGSFSASIVNGVTFATAVNAGACRRTLVSGLTPLSDYNVQQWFEVVGASTGTFVNKELIVESI